MKKMSRILLLLSITALMIGCKLAVIVVEGGEVQSTSSGTCVAGMICIVDVDDAGFSATFTAVPDTGWYFRSGIPADGFLVGAPRILYASFRLEGTKKATKCRRWLRLLTCFTLCLYSPCRSQSQAPLSLMAGNGRSRTFSIGLSWDEIKAVCSAQTGACSGLLNGYKMAGWTWASLDDVTALFNFYLGSEVLGVHEA